MSNDNIETMREVLAGKVKIARQNALERYHVYKAAVDTYLESHWPTREYKRKKIAPVFKSYIDAISVYERAKWELEDFEEEYY